MDDWKKVAFAGYKIRAIILIRKKNPKWSLKEAKLFIEGFIAGGLHAAKYIQEKEI